MDQVFSAAVFDSPENLKSTLETFRGLIREPSLMGIDSVQLLHAFPHSVGYCTSSLGLPFFSVHSFDFDGNDSFGEIFEIFDKLAPFPGMFLTIKSEVFSVSIERQHVENNSKQKCYLSVKNKKKGELPSYVTDSWDACSPENLIIATTAGRLIDFSNSEFENIAETIETHWRSLKTNDAWEVSRSFAMRILENLANSYAPFRVLLRPHFSEELLEQQIEVVKGIPGFKWSGQSSAVYNKNLDIFERPADLKTAARFPYIRGVFKNQLFQIDVVHRAQGDGFLDVQLIQDEKSSNGKEVLCELLDSTELTYSVWEENNLIGRWESFSVSS